MNPHERVVTKAASCCAPPNKSAGPTKLPFNIQESFLPGISDTKPNSFSVDAGSVSRRTHPPNITGPLGCRPKRHKGCADW
jgi:hypothetical protein